jgi:hypothetical protein
MASIRQANATGKDAIVDMAKMNSICALLFMAIAVVNLVHHHPRHKQGELS